MLTLLHFRFTPAAKWRRPSSLLCWFRSTDESLKKVFVRLRTFCRNGSTANICQSQHLTRPRGEFRHVPPLYYDQQVDSCANALAIDYRLPATRVGLQLIAPRRNRRTHKEPPRRHGRR